MLRLRTYDEIFPATYLNRPDEDTLCRRVRAHLWEVQLPRDVYEWIERMDDPYLREAHATACMHEIADRTADGEGFCNSYVREEVENHLGRIIRYAQSDQVAEEMLASDENPTAPMRYDASLEERVHNLEQLVGKLLSDAKTPKSDNKPHWPTYCANVTNQQKTDFEHYLHTLCTSKKKGLTKELKCYLKMKAEDGIIIRPEQQNTEFEILRKFGYPYAEKTYYNS